MCNLFFATTFTSRESLLKSGDALRPSEPEGCIFWVLLLVAEYATDNTRVYRNASPGLHTLSLGNTGNHIFVIFFSDCSLIFNSPISCSLRFYACTFLFRRLTCQTLSPLLLLLLRTKSFYPQLENLLTLRSQYTLRTCKAWFRTVCERHQQLLVVPCCCLFQLC